MLKKCLKFAGVGAASAGFLLSAGAAAQGPDESLTMPTTVGKAVRSDRTELHAQELETLLPPGSRPLGENYVVPNLLGGAEAVPRSDLESDPLAAEGQYPFASPTPGQSFNGPDSDDNAALYGGRVQPPDTNGDVGRENVVMYVNLLWRVFDKAGNPIGGPFAGNSFWGGFGGPCETNNAGDPVVLYDDKAGRWVFTQFAPYQGTQCFAISDGEDPTGPYTRYEFEVEPNAFNDYPKVGVWLSQDGTQSAYTYTGRNFVPQGSPLFARDITGVLFDRDAMLAGQPAPTFTSTVIPGGFVTFDGVQPGHQESGSLAPGAACPLFSVAEAPSTYKFFEFCENFPGSGSARVLTPVAVPAFDNGLGDVPEPAPGDSLDTLAFYTMYRASHKVVNGEHQLAMSHTVDAGSDRAGMRWAILDVDNYNSITLKDTGTQAPADGLERWMGSVTLDKEGNLGLGYTLGGGNPAQFPSVAYTGRETSDPPGTVQQEVLCVEGTGVQTGGYGRWGDYSSTSLDPEDECTFWTFQEYVETTGSFQWSTRVCSFSFPSCGGANFSLLPVDPGQAGVDNTWTTVDGTPNKKVLFVRGNGTGTTPFSYCGPGFVLDVGKAKALALPPPVADASGSAVLTRSVPAKFGGKTVFFQAVDLANCAKTSVISETF